MIFSRIVRNILLVAVITIAVDAVAFFAIKEIQKGTFTPASVPVVITPASPIPTFDQYIGVEETEPSSISLDFSRAQVVEGYRTAFHELQQKPANTGFHYSVLVLSCDQNDVSSDGCVRVWALNRTTGVVFQIGSEYKGGVALRADSDLVIVDNSFFYLLKNDHAEKIYTIN